MFPIREAYHSRNRKVEGSADEKSPARSRVRHQCVCGSNPYGKYWSGTTNPDNRDNARMQYFDDGNRNWNFKDDAYARVRCVRDGVECPFLDPFFRNLF